ncbi:hypothetical protein [Maricaulis parjimensis]|uniref:hypothetical protein n=1 Tax=Maricaulis parjimensis TaxID=144023 RepID=UPI00193ABB0F|nr:hypothetical protein [Maricaulis parjimensis]
MAKYASLHAGLLARKGEASPAIPSSFAGASYVDAPSPDASPMPARSASPKAEADPRRSLLQRRDIEAPDTPQPLLARKPVPPVEPAAPAQPDEQARGCCGAQLELPDDPHAGIDRAARAQVRLTQEQKRRLRTVAVQMNWPQQRILSDALDDWLDRLCEGQMSNCACLRARPE